MVEVEVLVEVLLPPLLLLVVVSTIIVEEVGEGVMVDAV